MDFHANGQVNPFLKPDVRKNYFCEKKNQAVKNFSCISCNVVTLYLIFPPVNCLDKVFNNLCLLLSTRT